MAVVNSDTFYVCCHLVTQQCCYLCESCAHQWIMDIGTDSLIITQPTNALIVCHLF